MAEPLTLKTAIGSYPHTRPLKDGSIRSPRLCLDHADIVPANRAFRPMVNQLAFDVCEMALVTLMLARDAGRPLVGVPVMLMQQSAYGMLLVRQDSPLRDPRDLAGGTIGVRSYTQTTGVWLRGLLRDQFGVDLSRLSWLTFEAAHVDGFDDPPVARRGPEGAALADLLRRGEIDAAAGLELREHPDLRTLIPDALNMEEAWIRQTGIRPVNHTLVVPQQLVAAEPWLPGELASLVGAAKTTVGSGPPDGLEANRAAVELLARYAFEQGITTRVLTSEDLFTRV
jgi:4,5-dihydroxyphthalate decarboxylase